MCGYKNSRFFHGWENVHLACLINVSVTFKTIHIWSDGLSCWLVMLYFDRNSQWRVHSRFKLNFIPFKIFSAWDRLISWQTLAVSAALSRAIGWKIGSFYLVFLLKASMNLNGAKWIIEMDWKTCKTALRSALGNTCC